MLNNEILLKAFFHKFHIWRWKFLVYGPCVLTLSPIASVKNIKKSFLIRFSHSVVQSTHLSAPLYLPVHPVCFSAIYLLIISLCFLVWHGTCWFCIVTLFSGAFDVTGRKKMRLVVLLYPV